MNVTKEGSLTKRATCERCKTEMEYEPEDVGVISYEDSPTDYYVRCPLCAKKLGPNACFVYVPSPTSRPKRTLPCEMCEDGLEVKTDPVTGVSYHDVKDPIGGRTTNEICVRRLK